jgi:glycosyltransferase involved in cell wall biosynthesis
MRIVQLTPGTGTFFCGSCVRDNALAAALRGLGHDALSVPLYLPHLVDESNASEGTPLFFGGVNVFLQQHSTFFRKTPGWLDRLFDARFLLDMAAKRAGLTDMKEVGALTVSMLRGEAGNQAKELDKLVAWLEAAGRPDVVCLSNALLMGMARRIRKELKVPVVCTLQGEDYFLDGMPDPYREQAWATLRERAAEVDAFIPVSCYYGSVMQERLGLAPDRVHVVWNGIALGGYTTAGAPPDPPAVGYFARMTPLKGLDTLVDAFILLRASGRAGRVKLRMAGSMTAEDEVYVSILRKRLEDAGLAGDAEFLPNVDHAAKQSFLRSLSVLSVPATYGESFGLYVLEALASGVPVVLPRHAAFPELIDATGGGVLVEPGDPKALAEGLEAMLLDPARARALAAAGREVVLREFSVERMAKGVAGVLEEARRKYGMSAGG